MTAILAAPARAQTTGSISGVITDGSSGKGVADAVVIATSPSLQGEQTAVTDATGSFEITLLPSGVYASNVQRESFKPFTQDGLTLRLDRTLKLQLQLTPEAFSGPAIDIIVQKPVISTSSAQTGSTVSKER